MIQNKDHIGSRWWKFDFHTHTPASLDYRGDKNTTPREYLQGYLNEGINCIVITDHNSGVWIDKLKDELNSLKSQDNKWEDMFIFPGVELSCNGGVHLLAIFDPSKNSSDIDKILGAVGYQGKHGDSDKVTTESILNIIHIIQEHGGITCAAHVDQPKGLLVSINDHNTLQPIFATLDAIEVIDPKHELIQKYEDSLKDFASVLGSDSHQSSDIGRGYTWIKMSNPSIEGLKLALLDPELAVRRSDDSPNYPQRLDHLKIKKITIEKLRLRQKNPLMINFNPGYNALIGGRGSGKSTVLECLRLGLARENELLSGEIDSALKSSFENFRKEKTTRDSPGMILNDTKITIELSKGYAALEDKFQYCWEKGENNTFSVLVKQWRNDEWQEIQLTEKQARNNFPVKIFSQKQIISLADHPQCLIKYIDDMLGEDKKNWENNFKIKCEALLESRKKVVRLEKQVSEKPIIELQYNEALHKTSVFKTRDFGNVGNVLKEYKEYEKALKQKQTVSKLFDDLSEYIQKLQSHSGESTEIKQFNAAEFSIAAEFEETVNQQINTLFGQLAIKHEQIVSIINEMHNSVLVAKKTIELSDWYKENEQHIDSYQSLEGINNAEDVSNALILEKKLKNRLEEIKKISTELEQAKNDVVQAQIALTQERLKLTELRQKFLDKVLESVPTLKITLHSMCDVEDGEVRLREILRIEKEKTFVKEIYGETDDIPPKLCGILWDLIDPDIDLSRADRIQKIKNSLENMSDQVLNTKLHGRFVKKLKDMNSDVATTVFDELSVWYPEDLVDIQYKRENSNSFQSLKQASAGQKTAAILSFLLAHGDDPLLMDQPEDDLDNALVSHLVVSQLRNNKNKRQLIVITHNANIVVNGDADLIIPMEFAGGQIVNNISGGLQEKSIRKKICEIMEGGEKAFAQRYKRILKDINR
ncbi:TrlF family AAA-like ATPase [Volucribacter amazonae]|uniref:RecF/RecN/SMC N-terminal domain-containing protein n=1 Tax=Volucribacter amazonae TaxID=256731 RepID=A0A9X4PNS5_9PAST|nr:AAA family ATPase [Volucribacter amazonae]MDG6895163.1 hypothetical protein [Volucribacter amazonae]